MKRIAYGKIGRAWKLDPTRGTSTGGDADVARALHILSRARPNDQFVLVGRNSGETPQAVGYPDNVINPWADEKFVKAFKTKNARCIKTKDDVGRMQLVDYVAATLFVDTDEVIMWAGQHGTSNRILPQVSDRAKVTTPQESFIQYASFLLEGINIFRNAHPDKDAIWLCPDPRNYLKMRDIKDPLKYPVVAQFEQRRQLKHERYGDPTEPPQGVKWDTLGGVWVASQCYSYGALEMTALPSPDRAQVSIDHRNRFEFGMLVNENRAYVSRDRKSIVGDWALSEWPDCEIFGKWTDASMQALGRTDIRPAPYEYVPNVIQRWRCTLTTPASGSGWATAKPWECFAYGTICFFHPEYDTQGWILPTLDQLKKHDGRKLALNDEVAALARWLRVESPAQLHKRVKYLSENEYVWAQLVGAQRAYYERRYHETQGGTYMIQERLSS